MSSQSRHIIIVCCHAIYKREGTLVAHDKDLSPGLDDEDWFLEPFQAGEGALFRQHIIEGYRVARETGGELWFSGGPTKEPQTILSESMSYRNLLGHLITCGSIKPRNTQTDGSFVVEHDDFATDSLQNVLFPILMSLSRRPMLGPDGSNVLASPSTTQPSNMIEDLPVRLTIVSHAFKKHRFLSQHLPTLGFSRAFIRKYVEYVGVDPDKGLEAQAEFTSGEERAQEQWARDPWAQESPLKDKRIARGWNDERVKGLFNILKKEQSKTGEVSIRKEIKEALINGATLDIAVILGCQ